MPDHQLLRDALYRWMLSTCRTPAAWSTYASRMWRWVAASGRRSLEIYAVSLFAMQLTAHLLDIDNDAAEDV